MESDFHITEYVGNSREQIKCLLKHLYSDFIVNEISSDGTVTKISYGNVSVETERNNVTEGDEILVNEEAFPPIGVADSDVEKIDAILKEKTGEKVEIHCEGLKKEDRTAIHVWVRQRYYDRLTSETKEGTGVITVSQSSSGKKRKRWLAGRPDYLHFTLSKEDKDSHYALSVVAKFINTKPSNMGICGTKDRRAITSQRVSVYHYEAEQLRKLNSRLRGIRLSDFRYSSKPCSLGDLWGNRFSIACREIQGCSNEEIVERMEEFKEKGFINYFGTQRFGSCDSITAQVGLAILKKNWEEAVRILLRPRDFKNIGEALKVWNETDDASAALKTLKGGQAFATVESRLLKVLSRSKRDYYGALMSLPRNTRSLYLHAYQSLIWNKVASRRIREFGTKVMKGDIDTDGNKIDEGASAMRIALPLPMKGMKFPDNIVGEWYMEYLKEDEIELDMFESLTAQFGVSNVLRPLFVIAKDVEYEMVKYPNLDTKLQMDLNGQFDEKDIGSGERTALQIRFSLPAGSYATIALRQITRSDMGKAAQIFNSKSLSEEEQNTDSVSDCA